MKRLTVNIIIFTAWGLSILFGFMPLIAVAEEGILEEIIVTARQREELLQDVPSSITAFTEADIERAGIERAEDFINLTPGVSMVDAAEVGDTQVSIRGINGSRDAEANFAFIIDGVLMTNPSAFNREFADLRQIEVLKGPQGAIYGRNGSAGAIIVTTRKPTNEFFTEIKGSVGNNDSYYTSGVVSGALVKDQLFGRLHFDFRTTDGDFHNSFLNDDVVDDFENYNINGRLIWEPNEDLSVDTRVRYGEVDAASITFNAAFALAGLPSPLLEDVNDHEFVFQGNVDPQNDQESLEFSIKTDYKMDWATASAWFLYSNIEQSFLADGTSASFGLFNAEPDCPASTASLFASGVTLPPPQFLGPDPNFPNSFLGPYTPTTCDGYQFQVRNQEDFSIDFRLTSPSEDRLRWQFGGYYLHLEREVGVGTGLDQTFSGVPIKDGLFVAGVTENLLHDEFTTEVYAGFGQLAYDVTPDIEASAALRYDVEDREVKNLVPVNATTSFILGGGAPLNPGIVVGMTVPDRDKSFSELQPKLSLTWDATENLTLYTTYGVGFKSGGFNNSGSAATVGFWFNTLLGSNPLFTPILISDQFKEEVSHSYEIGFKSELANGRVKIEGAFYHTDVDDMQVFEFFVGPFGLLRVVNNIDDVDINGGEFSLGVAVTDSLSLYGNVGVIDGEIQKNTVRPNTVGNEIPYSPEFTANLGADFTTPFMGDIDFVSHFDWQYVGETWFHTIQDEIVPGLFTLFGFPPTDLSLAKRDSYGVVNVRGGLKGRNWSVVAFARNLLDNNYLEEVIPAPEFGGSFIHPAARRAWGVEAVYRF